MRNEPRLLDRTREVTLLNALLRWFWLGRSQTAEDARQRRAGSASAVAAGIRFAGARRKPADANSHAAAGGKLSGRLRSSGSDRTAATPEMVLWPNPTSKFLARFAVRRHSRATLDLGTGSGILSLGAAGHSDLVVATDVNPRVPSFVTFNARLNGIENIEMLMGDGFHQSRDAASI